MVNINKNSALEILSNLVEQGLSQNLNYFSDEFNEKQKEALNLFKQRIFLEEVIEQSVDFNRKLNWSYEGKNLKLISSVEELIEVYKLRSDVFTQIGYQEEFPDTIEGLNFDIFDKTSGIIYYQKDKSVTATCRLIFDSNNKLPSEEKVSFDLEREKYNTIGEISRNIVKHESGGLNMEFKYLMCGIYNIFINNDIDIAYSGIKAEHYKLFHKLGGVDIYKHLESYGKVESPCLIISYNPLYPSKFFKRAFLDMK